LYTPLTYLHIPPHTGRERATLYTPYAIFIIFSVSHAGREHTSPYFVTNSTAAAGSLAYMALASASIAPTWESSVSYHPTALYWSLPAEQLLSLGESSELPPCCTGLPPPHCKALSRGSRSGCPP
jgi:hypothetical protein